MFKKGVGKIKTFQEILHEVVSQKEKKIISVAVAQDREVLLSVEYARQKGIVSIILVGDEIKIKKIANELSINLDHYKIINKQDDLEAVQAAVREVFDKRAHMLMKGLIDTSILLKVVLDKNRGLRTGETISHVALFEIENYDRLFFITDTAMNIDPTLETKKQIIKNSVKVAKAVGINMPKVACICATERVDKKMIDTVEAYELEKMNQRGEIIDCIVGGPFALDNVISLESAKHKGINHEVAGKADILLVPNIQSGNILYKSISYFAKSKHAGIIVGAAAPIILTSRSDSEESKFNSILLGIMTTREF